MWNPATSSVSASGRSNGARFVSAIPASTKTTKPTNCGTTNHMCAWARPISARLNVPVIRITPTSEIPCASSYEIICAEERSPPRSGYLLFDAQPPSTMP